MDLIMLLSQLHELIDEKAVVLLFTFLMYVLGLIVYIILLNRPAAYGRYSSTSGFLSVPVNAKLAWFIQELPSFLVPLVLILSTQFGWLGAKYDKWQLIILLCFTLHYFQRSVIYPFFIVGGKPTPFHAFFLAFVFCSVNGYMQARGALLFSSYPDDPLTFVRVAVGVSIFFFGFMINLHSDHILRNLRKPGETGYKIPIGGFFELVSCANFFGEIVEWFGFALASYSIVAFAFTFFTAANLIPRAIAHHRWYIEKFEDYPKDRKAVLPYLL